MTIDRRLIAGALGLSLVLAACGGSGASPAATTGGDETAAPTTEPVATTAPTQEPEATEEPTDDDGDSGPLNDLASKLPEKVGDITFERTGFDGDELGIYGAAAGLSGADLEPILKANGKTLNDVNFAFAASTGNEVGALLYAIQIEGLKAEDILSAMSIETTDMTEDTVAGKKVYTAGGGGFGQWIYPEDDTVYMILLASDDIAKGILEQLP